MELPQSKFSSSAPSPASVVKTLYVLHKSVPLLAKGLTIATCIEETGVDPVKALTLAQDLYSEPTLVALRAQHGALFDRFFEKIGEKSNNTKKIVEVVQKSSHPHADLFARALKTMAQCSDLGKILPNICTYLKLIDPESLSCDTQLVRIEIFSSELIASERTIATKIVGSTKDTITLLRKALEGKCTDLVATKFTEKSIKNLQIIYASLAKTFEKKRLEEVLEILTGKQYAETYAIWYQKAATAHLANKGSFKKAIRITVGGETPETPPSKISADGLTWRRALAEKKREVAQLTKQLQASLRTEKAADDSYVAEETAEYVIVEDPRNDMRITLYKTRQPTSEKAPEIGYHHRVSDLFMMDRAELVTKLATEKGISPLIANEAVRQKTPALAADWYINYAHDGFFIDKSSRNIPNKTLLCRIERTNKPAQEYFLVWGFLDDETCYHRGLTFNSSLDESITALANKTRYDFDFPTLEKIVPASTHQT